MKKKVVDKLNAFEMSAWRRMEKVIWQDKKTNEEVLTAAGEERCVGTCNSETEKELDRTCYAREQFSEACDSGKACDRGKDGGKKPRGRPRMGMIDDLKEGSYAEMKRKAEI
jgi:hypothetical protein